MMCWRPHVFSHFMYISGGNGGGVSGGDGGEGDGGGKGGGNLQKLRIERRIGSDPG